MRYDVYKLNKVFICGILGKGLSQLALFLKDMGIEVIGVDREIGEDDQVEKDRYALLESNGITCVRGWNNSQTPTDADVYLFSAGISKSNEVVSHLLENYKEKSMEYGRFVSLILTQYFSLEGDPRDVLRKMLEKRDIASLLGVELGDVVVIGITGTKGKTTSITMLYDTLCFLGKSVGMISTNGAVINGEELDTGLHVTTPDAATTKGIIEKMLGQNVQFILVEVTSHALVQQRLAGLQFDVAIFTNIAHEHLDYHGTWDEYAEAKSMLMDMVKPGGAIVVNSDDLLSYEYLVQKAKSKDLGEYVKIVGRDGLHATDVESKVGETTFNVGTMPFSIPITGTFNISNTLGVIMSLTHFNFSMNDIQSGLATYTKPDGRMEIVQRDPFLVVVDFAHTPDSLKALLGSLKQFVDEGNKLIVVFGCAGLRDDRKRSSMGTVAADYADSVVLVPEDPRTESLPMIQRQILEGVEDVSKIATTDTNQEEEYAVHTLENGKTVAVFNVEAPIAREQGIKHALSLAQPGDVVAITGKGHEQSLCFGVTEHPWDEMTVVKKHLNSL